MYCGLFFVAIVVVLLTVLSVAAVTGIRGISSRVPLFGMDAASEQPVRELQKSRVA